MKFHVTPSTMMVWMGVGFVLLPVNIQLGSSSAFLEFETELKKERRRAGNLKSSGRFSVWMWMAR